MDTDARTTALVLQALLARDKNDPLVPRGVRWLMENRRAGPLAQHPGDRDRAQHPGRLHDRLRRTAGSGAWSVTINGALGRRQRARRKPTELRKAISDLLINQDNTITITRQDNTGPAVLHAGSALYPRRRGK